MGEEREKNFNGMNAEEYKLRLLNKLNCLIAVLEVAITKINKTIETTKSNPDKLNKIKKNLENTLAICKRAKDTLERKIKQKDYKIENTGSCSISHQNKINKNKEGKMTYRDYVELSSIKEYQKFKKLPPIKIEEVKKTNVDELIKKLLS